MGSIVRHARRRVTPIVLGPTCGYAHHVPGLGWAPTQGLFTRSTLLLRRWSARSQTRLTLTLLACVGLVVVGVQNFPEWVPPSTFLLLEIVAMFLLLLRSLIVLSAAV